MNSYYEDRITALEAEGRIRSLKPLSGRKGCRVNYKGREMLNLSSNDYLGIAGDLDMQSEFYGGLGEQGFLDKFGLGAASSRLLTGDNLLSHELETILLESYKKEACLLFNSGYHANIGILPALLQKKDLILSDKLNHASITDGLRLSSSDFKRYRHCDYEHLRWILEKYRSDYERVVIVSESVFSMDGDVASTESLVALKEEFDALLYIDEAHGVGLYGAQGLGKAKEHGQLENIDLLVGTFGKAYASVGAFVLCSEIIKKYLVNTSRSLIFTTALPPVVINWNRFAFEKVLNLDKERKHLARLSEQLRKDLLHNGLETAGETNIVPVMLGKDSIAARLSEAMQQLGYLIFPVRPPTVPEGTARFRLSLTADMRWEELSQLATLISANLKILSAG